MNVVQIGYIVEGQGDEQAVLIVVRRIAERLDPPVIAQSPLTNRIPKSRLVRPTEFERAIDQAARRLAGQGAILVVLDSDDDCPAQLGPELLRRATQARSDVAIAVVLAKREFEAWFLAAAESLRGQRNLALDLRAPRQAEEVGGAKEWLSRHMPGNKPYHEVRYQPAFAALFDLDVARRADSFDKCYREIVRLLTSVQTPDS